MIRLAALALAISMAAGLTACGGSAASGSTSASSSAASDSSSTSAASQVEIEYSKNLTEDGKCSDIPLEVNIGKSYVTVVDIDEAGSLQTGLLSSFDLAATGTATGGEEVELAE